MSSLDRQNSLLAAEDWKLVWNTFHNDSGEYTYSSDNVSPYVYLGIHKITGEIYVGYREHNVILEIPSHIDIFTYRTSSNNVKLRFTEFDWYIVAEFMSGDDAYDFEQQLIYENWNNPLLLNRSCWHLNKKRFKNSGGYTWKTAPENRSSPWNKGIFGIIKQSLDTCNKKSTATKGRQVSRTVEHQNKLNAATIGRKQSAETVAKRIAKTTGLKRDIKTCERIGDIHRGKVISDEQKKKQSIAMQNKDPILCPHCGSSINGQGNFNRWHGVNCKKRSNIFNEASI